MPYVTFTRHLRVHAPEGPVRVEGGTVAEALDAVFRGRPALRGYLLDDQGRLRKHVTVFLDGRTVQDRAALSDPVGPEGEVFVMQALSGG
ncbi:MAG TPA: MoaD/ThiS family protein [Azospirillaceae bacterium]|nr:MoaD/ThiS family protein [Azospirillaceae bacterium]